MSSATEEAEAIALAINEFLHSPEGQNLSAESQLILDAVETKATRLAVRLQRFGHPETPQPPLPTGRALAAQWKQCPSTLNGGGMSTVFCHFHEGHKGDHRGIRAQWDRKGHRVPITLPASPPGRAK